MNILSLNYESKMTVLLQYCYKLRVDSRSFLLITVGKRELAAERAAFTRFA